MSCLDASLENIKHKKKMQQLFHGHHQCMRNAIDDNIYKKV